MPVYIIETQHSQGGKSVAVYLARDAALEHAQDYFDCYSSRLTYVYIWQTEPRTVTQPLDRKLVTPIAYIDHTGLHAL